MRSHRLLCGFLLVLIFLLSPWGCQTIPLTSPAPPIEVLVRDAETRSPIANARVSLWHNTIHAVPSVGRTGDDGIARVPPPPFDDTPMLYEVLAKGYLNRQTDQPAERTGSGVVLEVYAEPRPVLELVIPNGYHGMVRATVHVKNDKPMANGQRLFSYPVDTAKVAAVTLPPIFIPGCTPDIRMRYADGTPIPRDAKGYDIGSRWLLSDPDKEYIFVVGTQWEADEIRRSIKNGTGGKQTTSQGASVDHMSP